MTTKHPKVQVVLSRQLKKEGLSFLLLQTNAARGSFWQNITGHVEPNEDYQQAALRETQEETGLSFSTTDLRPLETTFEFVDRRQQQIIEKCFWINTEKKCDNLIIDPKEHQNYYWLPAQELKENSVYYPSNYQCLAIIKTKLGV